MAGELDDGEFWLPPQFLTEEDILMGFDTNSSTGFSSDLSSPVDSVTETESDDDESVSGLTRQIALSSLLPNSPNTNTTKGWVSSGKGCTSPPAKKGTGYFDSNKWGKQSTPVSALNSQNPNFQFQQVWSQERIVQRPANRKPHKAAQNLSGREMRAVFLGSTGSKRESVGTGVFLPRTVNPVEPHKKTNNKNGCAAVLVPEKVVQVLKNINAQPQCQSRLLDSSGGDNNGFHGSDNTTTRSEIRLPSEWTY